MSDVPTFLPIQENRSFVRDTRSMAVINVDSNARNSYRARREAIIQDKQALQGANTQIQNLKKEIDDLRQLVLKYVSEEK